MSIAIQRQNGDLIWLDAVLSYNKNYSSSISKHPIEDGSSIVDNVSQENPRFDISGIITNADFNSTRPEITSDDAKNFELSNRQIYNNQPVPDGKNNGPIIGNKANKFQKYLPGTVTQFLDGQPPSVEVPDFKRPDWVFEVGDIMQDMERNHDLVTILEFEGNTIKRDIKQCYITGVSFSENAETGDAFEVSIQLEQVTFVTLRDEKLSGKVVKSFEQKVAKKKNKGNVGTSAENGDPSKTPPKDVKSEMSNPGTPLKEITQNKVNV